MGLKPEGCQAECLEYREDKTLHGRLMWDASDELSFDFRGAYSEAEGGAINFNAVFAIPAFVSAFGSETFYADVNDHDFNFTFNVPGENEQKTTEFSVKADWEMGWADMTTVLAYSDLEEYLLPDGTSARFYGYELTPACQNDRRTLNSFARPDLFGPLKDGKQLDPGCFNQYHFHYYSYQHWPRGCDGCTGERDSSERIYLHLSHCQQGGLQ